MTTKQFDKWDIKQLLDIVSKGINSVLMTKPDVDPKYLATLSQTLLKIYTDMLNTLRDNQDYQPEPQGPINLEFSEEEPYEL